MKNFKVRTLAFPWQFILSLAHESSCENFADTLFSCKAPEDWRTPGRFADFWDHRVAHSVLDCGGPPPLFPEAYQTVPMFTSVPGVHRRSP